MSVNTKLDEAVSLAEIFCLYDDIETKFKVTNYTRKFAVLAYEGKDFLNLEVKVQKSRIPDLKQFCDKVNFLRCENEDDKEYLFFKPKNIDALLNLKKQVIMKVWQDNPNFTVRQLKSYLEKVCPFKLDNYSKKILGNQEENKTNEI